MITWQTVSHCSLILSALICSTVIVGERRDRALKPSASPALGLLYRQHSTPPLSLRWSC